MLTAVPSGSGTLAMQAFVVVTSTAWLGATTTTLRDNAAALAAASNCFRGTRMGAVSTLPVRIPVHSSLLGALPAVFGRGRAQKPAYVRGMPSLAAVAV